MLRLTIVVLALASALASPSRANVFGPDSRIALESDADPFRAIGHIRQYVSAGDGDAVVENCTGTLVAPRLVLTAAHCVARNEAGRLSQSIRTVFFPGGDGRDGYRAVDVRAGSWRNESDSRAGDWAVLLLDRSPDATPLPVSGMPPTPGTPIAVFGYSADFRRGEKLSGDLRCRIRALMWDGVYHHDCATYAGASGGPAVRLSRGAGGTPRMTIVGVHSAHRSRGTKGLRLAAWNGEFANLLTGAVNFATPLDELIRRHAGGPVALQAALPPAGLLLPTLR